MDSLKSLAANLDKLAVAIHHQTDALRANTESHKEPRVIPEPVDLKLPASISVQNYPYGNKSPARNLRDGIRLVAEIAGLGVLIWYAFTTSKQWEAQVRANELTKSALVLGQRAYLSYGAVEQIPSGLKIHLSNFGHVPAKITGGSLRYVRITYPQNVGLTNIARNLEPLTIMPEAASEAAILLDMPTLSPEDQSAVLSGHQMIIVGGNIRYDTGFGSTDELYVGVTYEPRTKRWEHVNSGSRVDFVHPPNDKSSQKN